MSPVPRSRKGPLSPLRIDLSTQNTQIALALGDSSASALSSATSESDYNPFHSSAKPRSLRNMKKLSLTLPSARSSTNSLSEPQSASSTSQPEISVPDRPRRSSVVSLPNCTNVSANSALLHRKEEEGDPAVPYSDGPIQILPSIWLGSEDNARDWKGLMQRGIKSILNVAKEVASPFDSAAAAHPLRSTVSTPNFHAPAEADPTFYPAHPASGRPGMHYLKLQWSHGQQDLVESGFQAGMAFTDAAVERGEGVLIHCQCGISRSATMAIALVMRAAAERSSSVPSEIWALKGMQGAYTYVKEKSKWVGPNMSLIYQLLDYERKLGGCVSPSNSERSLEEEWSRRRKLLDDEPSDAEDEDENFAVMQEARALDKAMEDRVVARKASSSSVASSGASSGIGMGTAWRSRYGTRKRNGSVASSVLSEEELVEEDEEQELLGVGGGFDSSRPGSAEYGANSITSSPERDDSPREPVTIKILTPATARPILKPPPSAPIWKTSFGHVSPPPATATRSTFDIPSRTVKPKRRPMGLGILPPVPSSPIQIIIDTDGDDVASTKSKEVEKIDARALSIPHRVRLESKKPAPPPLQLRSSVLTKANKIYDSTSIPYTPSQTLLVFPPSPTKTRTPSTMTLTSSMITPVPFPGLTTPRVSTFRSVGGRTRSFIGLGAPPTPTTAFSKVDARGYVGLD